MSAPDRDARLAAIRDRARQVADSTQPYLPDTLWLLRALDELLAEIDRQAAAERTARAVAAANDRAARHALRDCDRAEAERDEARADTARLRDQLADAEAKVRAVRMVRCWRNEDGKRFVFADDLRVALDSRAASDTAIDTPQHPTAEGALSELRAAVRRGLADIAGCCPECDAASGVIRYHVDPHLGEPAPTCATCGHRPDQHRKGENLRFCAACPDDQDGTDLHPYTPTDPARPAAPPAEPHNTCDHILRPVPDVPVVWCEKCGGSFPHLGGCARSGSDDCWARCCAPTRFPAPAEPPAAVEVVPLRWGGEEAWIGEDGSVGVPLTLPGGQPAHLTLDGDAPRLLGEELIACHKTNTREEN